MFPSSSTFLLFSHYHSYLSANRLNIVAEPYLFSQELHAWGIQKLIDELLKIYITSLETIYGEESEFRFLFAQIKQYACWNFMILFLVPQ